MGDNFGDGINVGGGGGKEIECAGGVVGFLAEVR
jgi:hypothetical protein